MKEMKVSQHISFDDIKVTQTLHDNIDDCIVFISLENYDFIFQQDTMMGVLPSRRTSLIRILFYIVL
ncbi:hypothetical protein L1987_54091 [Smallanthus sonchifolius]|uniref:Uncharacterized protein n=1 Tax=Smallanthus sonchifolius TaxID=185202 RepID=A0ACB9E5W0_9ASTR|nr:hypothetical protein L1987_54091 [Smallanthus sonchifolius]